MDSIHNQGLRLALGAFRTSPVNSLYPEANEPSLNLRRKKRSLQYYLKLKSNHDNPTHKVVFEPLYKDEFLKREKGIPPFSLHSEADIDCLDCDLEDVANYKISEVPLWTSKSPTYLITDPIVFKTEFLEVKEQHYTYGEIYTNGSQDVEEVASAAILDGELYISSVYLITLLFFSAELKAIDLALNHIEQDAYWRYIIFTDSLSAMQVLEAEKTDSPLIVDCVDLAPTIQRFFCMMSTV